MAYLILVLIFFILIVAYFSVAIRYNIIDRPNDRSSHDNITIRGGGVIFLFAAIFEGIMHPGYWLPALGISAVAGYLLGTHFDHSTAPLILGGALAFGAVLVGAISGIMGGTKELQWESYRIYPLSLREIFAAELVAGIGDPWPMLAGLSTHVLHSKRLIRFFSYLYVVI